MLRLLLALTVAGCGGGASTPPSAPASSAPALPPTSVSDDSAPLSLFEFADGEAPWNVVNDGVMGGLSKGQITVEDGTLRFTGELVTQGGGFTSVRAAREADLAGAQAIELRVRGGGRTFEVDLDDGSRLRGRQVSRRAAFPTTEDWQTVRIPFSDLESSVFGQPVRVDPFDPSALRAVGVFIADGIDGPFRLEVDWIRVAD